MINVQHQACHLMARLSVINTDSGLHIIYIIVMYVSLYTHLLVVQEDKGNLNKQTHKQ